MYKPETAKESAALPVDSVLDGTIVSIDDGKVRDFIQNTEKWKGDIAQSAINVIVEIKVKEKSVQIDQLFTYNEFEGLTTFSPKSNLGMYKRKYGNLPMVGGKVKISTNGEGFGRLKLT